MPMIPVDGAVLEELLARRDDLVRAITVGMASGDWDRVMPPFEGLLVALKRLEVGLAAAKRQTS